MRTVPATSTAQNAKDAAKTSLRESMGAVAAVLSATPDNIVRMPKNVAELFLLTDPALSMIHRQLLDARAHNARIALMLGAADPMMEALSLQITALENAYAARLAALKRRREEGRAAQKERNRFTKVIVEKLPYVRAQLEKQTQRENTLWSWIFYMLLANQTFTKTYGPRLDAA